MTILAICLIVILFAETSCWTVTIVKHASWLSKHPDYEDGMATSGNILMIASCISGIFALLAWAWLCHTITLYWIGVSPWDTSLVVTSLLCVSILFSHIHFWALLARYTCLSIVYWPYGSYLVSRLLNKYTGTRDIGHYCLMFEKWNNLSIRSGLHRSVIINFLDLIPDLVWTKDLGDKFTYVNTAICKKLLLCKPIEAIGKTGLDLAEEARQRGKVYTFGEVCDGSDAIVKDSGQIEAFMESGIVDDHFLALHVLKAPIYQVYGQHRELVGTIGVGRDVTRQWREHNEIMQFINDGQFDEASRLFTEHKQKFEMHTMERV